MVMLAGYVGWRFWDRFQRPAPNVLTKAAYEQIKDGMTTAEVEAILGQPARSIAKDEMPEEVRDAMKEDVWIWGGRRLAGKEIRVYFKDGRVSRKESDGL